MKIRIRPRHRPTRLHGRPKAAAFFFNSLAWATHSPTCLDASYAIYCTLYIICVLYCMYDQKHTVLFLPLVYCLYFK